MIWLSLEIPFTKFHLQQIRLYIYGLIPAPAVCRTGSSEQHVQVRITRHNLIYTNRLFSFIKRENPISEAGGWDAQYEQIQLDTRAQHGATVSKLTEVTCIYLY